MDIGLLTVPLTDKPLDWVVDFAKRNGFQALEVVAGPGSNHLDTVSMSDARVREVKYLLDLIRAGCRGFDEPVADVCRVFNAATNEGAEMAGYSEL
ncbi:MAG: hypothetical protein MUQ26_02805, partial [Armatimonadetes bacterium]|nr:hypothetical protein [Armatimonadota bacterium]